MSASNRSFRSPRVRSSVASEGTEGTAAVGFRWRQLLPTGLGLLSAAFAVAVHHPADSVGLFHGSALYLTGLLLLAAVTLGCGLPDHCYKLRRWLADWSGFGVDLTLVCAVIWVGLSVVYHADEINRRQAMHEFWWWAASAATFIGARRWLGHAAGRRLLWLGMLIVGGLLSIHGWHQVLVSYPAILAKYEADPDSVLAAAGIAAPEGSAQRMNFDNRLRDGGPIATFALSNSLAGVLIPSLILSAGVLFLQFRLLSLLQRLTLGLISGLIGSMVLQINSRSALGALVLVAIVAFTVILLRSTRWADSRRMRQQRLVLGLAVVISGLMLVVQATRNPEFRQRAVASLAFRVQYWQGTARMVSQSPWFGCGPGVFQAAYEKYRPLTAVEQVADPHNFLMQAAASGGIPLALGMVIFVGMFVVLAFRPSGSVPEAGAAAGEDLDRSGPTVPPGAVPRPCVADTLASNGWGARGVRLGFGLGMLAVWMLGWLTNQAPDVDPYLWGWPLMLLTIGLLRSWWRNLQVPTGLLLAASLGTLIHLCFSGGWLIPGVALPMWLLVAAAFPFTSPEVGRGKPTGEERAATFAGDPAESTDCESFSFRPRAPVVALAVCMLLTFWITEFRPTSESQRWLLQAEVAIQHGRFDEAIAANQRAALADAWDPTPHIHLARLWQQALLRSDQAASRREYQNAERAATDLGGNPTLWGLLAELRIHLFQRWGQQADLVAASQFLENATDLAPANEHSAAQWAAVLDTLQETDQAEYWAERTVMLASAGNHIQRQLERIVILQPIQLGVEASEQPRRISAQDFLANRGCP